MERRAAVLLAALLAPASVAAQRPTVSPGLARSLGRDTILAVWLFARAGQPVENVAARVVAAGGRVRRTSRWLHAVSADLPSPAVRALALEPVLRHLQLVGRFRRRATPPAEPSLPARVPPGPPTTTAQDSVFGPSAMPFRRLNLFPLTERGVTGRGVRIAILDTGFQTDLPAFASTTVLAQRDFVFDDSIVRNEPADDPDAAGHGTATWSLLAANLPGVAVGIAPDAGYILAKTEDIRSETPVEEDNYVAALEWADSAGASVVSSSITYLDYDTGPGYSFSQLNGDIAITTVAADLAAQRGIVVVAAIGNGGPQPNTLTTPGDADSVITVGAVDSTGVLASFSSRGPTADGRFKPDLTAPGVAVQTVSPAGVIRQSGTSFSTPIVAGAVALMKELHPTFGPIEIRDALRRTANATSHPGPDSGWGTPNVALAATFPLGVFFTNPGSADSALSSITPTFAWSAPAVPALALPVSYQFVVIDSTLATAILDTTLAETQVSLTVPLRPEKRLILRLIATAADSVRAVLPSTRTYAAPQWATLQTLNDPGGSTIRDPSPTFTWSSPAVHPGLGPFTYDIEVVRTSDGLVEASARGLSVGSFTPGRDLERNTPYRWRVRTHLGADTATTESRGVFVVIDDSAPPLTLLFQNFPNPFPDRSTGRLTTCLWFDLAGPGQVRLDILDLRGHLVRTLFGTNGEALNGGRYGRPLSGDPGRCDPRFEWDGRNEAGAVAPQGVYLARLQTPAGRFFKRIVFLGPDF